MRPALVVAALSTACLVVGLTGCTPSSEPRAAGLATTVVVVDGDTIVAEVGGREETIRLVGIDTPETVHPDKPPECFGAEASAELDRLLPEGTELRLERDTEARDRFDRLLAYVWRVDDGLFVNEALVASGHADARTVGDNRAYAPRLRRAEDAARRAGAGLWGACGGPDVPAVSAG